MYIMSKILDLDELIQITTHFFYTTQLLFFKKCHDLFVRC